MEPGDIQPPLNAVAVELHQHQRVPDACFLLVELEAEKAVIFRLTPGQIATLAEQFRVAHERICGARS